MVVAVWRRLLRKDEGIMSDHIHSRHIAIHLDGVSVGYNGQTVLREVTLDITRGLRLAVLGPNGAGKSTLFKAIMGLLPLRSGHLLIHGEAPRRRDTHVAYVPQHEDIDARFPVTVRDVVTMGRYGRIGWLRRPGAADRQVVAHAMRRLDILALADKPLGDLSGGQMQRAFLARALAQEADILLLDEPFTGVDAMTESAIYALLDELKARNITVLLATHDLDKATTHFDDLLLVNGSVVACGCAEDVFRPEILRRVFGAQVTLMPAGDRVMAAADSHHQPQAPAG
jgi:ABC-type Mn2+/Zn2+ transport system ATPase subunit